MGRVYQLCFIIIGFFILVTSFPAIAADSDSIIINDIIVDKTKPSLPTLNGINENWVNQDAEVSVSNIYDPESNGVSSGVEKVIYSIGENTNEDTSGANFTIVVSPEGETVVTAKAIDKAGNAGDQVSGTVKLDRTAPTVTISGVESKTYYNTVIPVFSAEDTLSGLQECTATLAKNGQTPVTFSSNTPISEPGAYVLMAVATDNAGNQTIKTVNFTLEPIAMGDITANAITSGSIKISWAAVENANGYYVFEGETKIAGVTDTDYIHESLNPNTQYKYKVVPYNALGEGISSQSVSIYTLANQPANLGVTGKTSTTLTVAWEANNNPDTVEYAVGIDGTYTEFVANKLIHEFTGLTVGKAYTVSVKARNSNGRETEPISISETTNTAPVINISNPVPETAYSEVEGHNIIIVSGTVMDTDNDNVTVTATINGISKTATVEQCKIAREFTIEFSVNDIPEGRYSITVTASDGK